MLLCHIVSCICIQRDAAVQPLQPRALPPQDTSCCTTGQHRDMLLRDCRMHLIIKMDALAALQHTHPAVPTIIKQHTDLLWYTHFKLQRGWQAAACAASRKRQLPGRPIDRWAALDKAAHHARLAQHRPLVPLIMAGAKAHLWNSMRPALAAVTDTFCLATNLVAGEASAEE
jgi:hypothetical protein